MARLTIKNDRFRRGVVCVALSGELDMSSAYCLDAELRRLEQTQPEMLIVDLRDLTFMDTSGLARLLAAHRRARNGGWRLGLIRGPEAVERMLRLAATQERFLTVPDPAGAPA
jgi:anti-sigma B factor antagonist